jgi:cell division septal protein FtsQ
MATEEGESSSKVVILKTTEVIKRAKDKDRDIEITLNNNISLKRPIKVVPLPKFNGDLSKLEEYLNKV